MTINDNTSESRIIIYILGGISLLACTWLLIKVTRTENKAFSVRMIRWIAFIDFCQDLCQLYREYLASNQNQGSSLYNNLTVAVYVFNASSLLWSSALAFLSYKMMTMAKLFDKDKFYFFCKLYILPANIILGFIYRIFYEKNPGDEGPSPVIKYMKYFWISPSFGVAIFLPFLLYCRYY